MKEGQRLISLRQNKWSWFIPLAIAISMLAVFFSLKETSATETKEMIYVTGYDKTYAIDPETMEVAAEIPTKGPNREVTWTKNGQRLFINNGARQEVTIVDTLENKVIDTVTFNDPDNQIISRIYGLAVDPEGEKLYATLMRTQRKPTELVPLDPIIAVMDLETKEIVDEINVPLGTHALQFLEDPNKLVVWAKDVYMLDVETKELTKYYDLTQPTEQNGNTIVPSFLYFWHRDQDSANSLTAVMARFYPETEKVTENIFMIDRKNGNVTNIELPEQLGLFSAVVSPDKKYAYGGMNHIYKINLETFETQEIVHKPGTSYGFNLSRDGKTLYVSGAGPDISFIDTETMEYKKIIDLPTDTMDLRVVEIQK